METREIREIEGERERERERFTDEGVRESRDEMRQRERESQRSGESEPASPEPRERRRLDFRPMLPVDQLRWCLGRETRRTQELGPAPLSQTR